MVPMFELSAPRPLSRCGAAAAGATTSVPDPNPNGSVTKKMVCAGQGWARGHRQGGFAHAYYGTPTPVIWARTAEEVEGRQRQYVHTTIYNTSTAHHTPHTPPAGEARRTSKAAIGR